MGMNKTKTQTFRYQTPHAGNYSLYAGWIWLHRTGEKKRSKFCSAQELKNPKAMVALLNGCSREEYVGLAS